MTEVFKALATISHVFHVMFFLPRSTDPMCWFFLW